MNKYILYSTQEEWNASNDAMNTLFGLPDSHGNERYAEIQQVSNLGHNDFGKYIFPITTTGNYVTINEFNVSDMVEFDPEWASDERI
jgi:hypothetical protein